MMSNNSVRSMHDFLEFIYDKYPPKKKEHKLPKEVNAENLKKLFKKLLLTTIQTKTLKRHTVQRGSL